MSTAEAQPVVPPSRPGAGPQGNTASNAPGPAPPARAPDTAGPPRAPARRPAPRAAVRPCPAPRSPRRAARRRAGTSDPGRRQAPRPGPGRRRDGGGWRPGAGPAEDARRCAAPRRAPRPASGGPAEAPSSPGRPSGVSGSAARTSDRSRRVSGCRASGPASASSGIPYLSRARRASPSVRSPSRTQAGSDCPSPPDTCPVQQLRGNSRPGPLPVLGTAGHHEPSPVLPQPLDRPRGPLGQPVGERRRHLLGPVEKEQQGRPCARRAGRAAPAGCPPARRRTGRPTPPELARRSPETRHRRSRRSPGRHTPLPRPRALVSRRALRGRRRHDPPRPSSARRAASATEASSARRSAPRSHSVGAGSDPRPRRAARAASSVVRPLPGGPTRPRTVAGPSAKAVNSPTTSTRSTGAAPAAATAPAPVPGPSDPTVVAVSSSTPARFRSVPYAATVAALRASSSASGCSARHPRRGTAKPVASVRCLQRRAEDPHHGSGGRVERRVLRPRPRPAAAPRSRPCRSPIPGLRAADGDRRSRCT